MVGPPQSAACLYMAHKSPTSTTSPLSTYMMLSRYLDKFFSDMPIPDNEHSVGRGHIKNMPPPGDDSSPIASDVGFCFDTQGKEDEHMSEIGLYPVCPHAFSFMYSEQMYRRYFRLYWAVQRNLCDIVAPVFPVPSPGRRTSLCIIERRVRQSEGGCDGFLNVRPSAYWLRCDCIWLLVQRSSIKFLIYSPSLRLSADR